MNIFMINRFPSLTIIVYDLCISVYIFILNNTLNDVQIVICGTINHLINL